MLPSYFDYIFVHLRQKVRLRPGLNPKLLSTLGPSPTRTPGPTYNSSWQLAQTFKSHTAAISVHAIVPSPPITLIKVRQQGHQNEDSRPVSHWHCT